MLSADNSGSAVVKIVFVITGLGVGGAERQVVDLADRFVGLGHEVKIIYLTGNVRLRPSSDAIELIGLDVPKSPLGFIWAIFSLARHLRAIKPDIVHSHMVHANLLARLSRLIYRVPRLVCTAHNSNEGGVARMLAYRVTNGLADVSTNVSVEAVQSFEKKHAVPVGQMLSMVNGIDVHRFQPNLTSRIQLRRALAWGDAQVFLAVGRLVEAKDYPNLLGAFFKLHKDFPDARLCVVGDGPLRSEMEKLVNDRGLAQSVQFLGIRDDIPELMNAADFFVLSSAWEGFGLVVAEAMAAQKIVIATDCGGVSEVLGGHGILVKPRNSQMLTEAMQTAMLLKPAKAQDMARAARAWVVDHYSIDSVAREWIKVYGMDRHI